MSVLVGASSRLTFNRIHAAGGQEEVDAFIDGVKIGSWYSDDGREMWHPDASLRRAFGKMGSHRRIIDARREAGNIFHVLKAMARRDGMPIRTGL